MADITVTAADVRVVFAEQAEFRNVVAAATITAGQLVYMNTSGKVDLCDFDAIASGKPYGIALEGAAADQALSVLKRGYLAGYNLSSQAYGARIYSSATPGALSDAAATSTPDVIAAIGCVDALSDPSKTKVLRVDIQDGFNYVAL